MGRGRDVGRGASKIVLIHKSKCRCACVGQSLLSTENAGCTGVLRNSKCWGLGSGKLCGEMLAAAKKREGLERYLN